MTRYTVFLLGTLCLFPSLCSSSQAAETAKPNIVLILVDDVGWDAIGCYGGESYKTPNVDRLCSSGMKLNHFYVSPVCHPTRVGLMSGRYLHSMGNPRWGYYPKGDVEQQTLAFHLRENGYATAAAGKWHLAKLDKDPQQPHRAGFNEYCFFGWHEGPRYWDPLIWKNGKRLADTDRKYGPDVYTDFLIDFMQRNKKKPFFAYYPMALCHAVSDDFTPRPPHSPKGRYFTFAEMMSDMDRYVGKIIDALDELKLRENTLILFTTDNGTTGMNFIRHEGDKLIRDEPTVSKHDGEMIPGGKGKFTDWGIRVPTILSWKGHITPGSSSEQLIDVTDVLPTLVDVAGANQPSHKLDGLSFAELIDGKKRPKREWIITQTKSTIAVRNRQWKLVGGNKLYKVNDDLHREKRVSDQDLSRDAVTARQQLRTIWEESRSQPESEN